MSHFSRIRTKISNRKALVNGLERLGLKAEVHETPTQLINTWGDKDFAEVIVRRSEFSLGDNLCRADLGFRLNTETQSYEAVFDQHEFRNTILKEKFASYTNFVAQLQCAYEIENVLLLYPASQYNISEPVLTEDGSYTLEITEKVDPFSLQVGAGY